MIFRRIVFGVVFFVGICLLLACKSSVNKDAKTSASVEAAIKTGDIRDMVLIYDGGAQRKLWDEESFEPYVSALSPDGKTENWLFDGFLFLEIYDGTYGFDVGYKKIPARKEHWMGLIDGYLTKGKSIKALDACLDKAKRRCKDPLKKRKIVISLPEPIPNQKDWGEIDGTKMDFSDNGDRLAAVKWYIDYVTQRFKEEKMKNVELGGFYWLVEEVINDKELVKEVADYIHQKKSVFYWIPYYKAPGYSDWKSYGFDQAFLQPNHFFDRKVPDSRIDEAYELAKSLGMSLEIEFDEDAREGKGKGERLRTYLNGFKKNNVFETLDIAYYQGGDGLYLLRHGTENDKALYYEFVNIIAERQKQKK